MKDAPPAMASPPTGFSEAHRRLDELGARPALPVARQAEGAAEAWRDAALLEAISVSSPDLIYAKDRDCRLIYANPAVLAAAGWPTGELLGRKAEEFLHVPEEGLAHSANDRNVMESGRAATMDEHYTAPDGRRRVFRTTKMPLRDPEGRVVGLAGVSVDVTDQRAAEAALRASEQELRLVTDAVPVLIAFIDVEERYRFINATYESWFGLPREAVIGRGMRDFLGEEAYDARRERVRAALRGEPQHFETFTPTVEGGRRDTELRYIPRLAADGTVEGFIALVSDVTDRNATATELKRLNAALETRVAASTAERDRLWRLTTDLMLVARLDGAIIAVNPAWTVVSGWTEAELLEASFLDLAHPDDRNGLAEKAVSLARGRTTLRFDGRLRTRSGEDRWLSWTAVSEDGLIHAVARDVSAEKEQAAELERAEEALQQARKMEAIGQLTGGVAHDFNNLLGAVVGNLDLLGRKLGDERLRRYVDGAMAGAQLTRQLLAFARKQRLSPQPVDVNRLAHETVTNLLQRTLGGMIRVDLLAAEGLWPAVIDPSQLESAILNLALNARDAMPDGGSLTVETGNVRIREGSHVDLAPGDYVLVTLTDTGLGMPPEVAARATEPFFTTKGVGKGTGLGLSTVYGFLRQSGGTLRITSHPGEGTSVQLYLPRSSEPAADRPAADGEVAAEGRGALVLLVDDDEGVRASSAELLRELGYAVIEAAGGQRALEILEANPDIRLMVADYAMPGMNGAELLARARAMRPELRTVVATGYAQGAELDRLLPRSAVLRKPFGLAELAEGLRAVS